MKRHRSVRRCAGEPQRIVSRCKACQLVFVAAALSSVHQSSSFVHQGSSSSSSLQRASADVGSCTIAARHSTASCGTSCTRNALERPDGALYSSASSSSSSSSSVSMSIARGMRPSSSLQHALPIGECLYTHV
jgi:hypothetical protein